MLVSSGPTQVCLAFTPSMTDETIGPQWSFKDARLEDNRWVVTRIEHVAPGITREHDVDTAPFLTPGMRKTGNVDLLVGEARQHADEDRPPVGNPAFPIDEATSEYALAEMEREDLDPAWLNGLAVGVFDYPRTPKKEVEE